MAHTGIFATSDEILVKAGANVSSAGATETRINTLCLQAEATINTITKRNWSDDYSGLNADVKHILSEAESNFVATYLIIYDMSGFTSRYEAETMLDVLRDGFMRNISALKNISDVQAFMDSET